MRLLKRFYALVLILLFISITYLVLIAENGSGNIVVLKNPPIQADIDKFVGRLFPKEDKSNLHYLNIQIPNQKLNQRNIIEIDESNIHQASIIVRKNNQIKAYNWFQCKPNTEFFLCTNPYFIFNKSDIKSTFTIVYSGSPLDYLPVKLYSYNNFFLRKANQETAKTIILILLILVFFTLLFFYFMIKSFYSLIFSIYIFLCLVSNALYNGFTNNFWPFNIPTISDHSLGFILSLHLLSVSTFLLFLVRKQNFNFKYKFPAYLFFTGAIALLLSSIILESFDLLKYLLIYGTALCISFTSYYPVIFSDFKKKDAYWLNYLGIISMLILFTISTCKYYNVFYADTIFNIFNRVLFLGHILGIFLGFLFIIKNKLIGKISSIGNLILESNDFSDYYVNDNKSIPEILATLSEREYLVLELISIGLKDQEIADKLSVSITTIKTQKQRVYRKLNINNRTQATQIFLKFTSKTINFINN